MLSFTACSVPPSDLRDAFDNLVVELFIFRKKHVRQTVHYILSVRRGLLARGGVYGIYSARGGVYGIYRCARWGVRYI
jgi:hypothetical protein